MAVDLTYNDTLTAVETIAQNVGGAPALTNKITHTAFNVAKVLGAATTPPVSKCAHLVAALVAGTLVIDLTALVGTNAGVIDGTGLKLQILRITNNGANAMTIAQGATNPCAIGAGMTIPPGGTHKLEFNNGLAAVGAGAKNLLLTGTGTQTANVTIVALLAMQFVEFVALSLRTRRFPPGVANAASIRSILALQSACPLTAKFTSPKFANPR